ncbi:hypothetical protein FANTH_10907 [Fusarium anthophilum]|uniref:Uncharacterized protein n=1 Tax=Fusarium anthophilum TaxID=48485 RepID=A0A8H4YZI9_9HYPO|nr:hypothetical protein FANTH_10907 [Fusarium anthophilum]
MNNTFGVAGTFHGTRQDLIQKRFKKINVKVLIPKEDSDKVPDFIVTGSNPKIPEKWVDAPVVPKGWLLYMMKMNTADLVWVDPKEWVEKQEQGGGGEEGEDGEEGEEEEEKESRGTKRNTEDLRAEVEAEFERKKQEKEAKKKQEEEAKKKKEEAKKKQEEEAKKQEEEAKKKKEEAKKKQEEEAKKQEEEAKKKQEEEAKKKQEEEAKKQEEEAKKKKEEAKKKQEEEAKARAQADAKGQADQADQADKGQGDKDQADATDASAKDQADATDASAKDQADATNASAKDQADATDASAKDQADASAEAAEVHTAGREKGTGPVKQESAEPNLGSIPNANSAGSSKSPSPDSDPSSTSSQNSASASSTPSPGTSPSPGARSLSPDSDSSSTSSESSASASSAPSPGTSPSPGARSLSPEAEDAEKQAQNAIIKAREARTELERAQRAATEAVDNARTLGAAVTYIPDLQPDDPCAFVIPGYMRKEKTPAMGRIAYNTDKGYFLVLEPSFKGRHRMYMFSGSQYFSNRDAFVNKYKWKTLVANVHAGEEQDEDDKLWKISIEGVAVLRTKGKNSKIFRVLITWRDNNNPDSELPELSNLTGFKRRFGKDATQRLAAEQRLSNMPMDWLVPPQSTDNDDGKAAYFRRHRAEFEGMRLLEGI